MEWVDILRSLIEPRSIYLAGFDFSKYVAPFSGFLLIMAAHIRVVETQLAGHGMAGGWSSTLKAIAIWSFILSVYYSLFAFIVGFANEIYGVLNQVAGIDNITNGIAGIQKLLRDKAAAEDAARGNVLNKEYWAQLGAAMATLPGLIGSMFIFKITTFAMYTAVAVIRIAHAVLFSLAFVLGLLVIPLNITESLSFRHAWKSLCIFVFIWPIIEMLTLGMASLPFKNMLQKMLADSTHYAAWDSTNFMMVTSVLCVITVILEVVSVKIAYQLASNTGALATNVQPIVNIIHKVYRRGR
jgi:hypothetical protein